MPNVSDPHTFLTRYLNLDLNSLIPLLSSDNSYSHYEGKTVYYPGKPSSYLIDRVLENFRRRIIDYGSLTPEIMNKEINELYNQLCNLYPKEYNEIKLAFDNITSNLSKAGIEVRIDRTLQQTSPSQANANSYEQAPLRPPKIKPSKEIEIGENETVSSENKVSPTTYKPLKKGRKKLAAIVMLLLFVLIAITGSILLQNSHTKYSITGRVYDDINENGALDSLDTYYNAPVTIYLANSSGFIASCTTNSSGYYSFDDLAVGSYVVSMTLPSGYYNSSLSSQNINITSANISDVNFGIYTTYTLSGEIWDELIYNGVPNVNVNLCTRTGSILETIQSDSGGLYSFTNLSYGFYTVKIDLPKGSIGVTTSQNIGITGENATANLNLYNLLAGPKTVQLKYTLRGVTGTIPFVVYSGMYDYLLNVIPDDEVSYTGSPPSQNEITTTLTLAHVNEQVEQGEIMKLVGDIKNVTSNPDDQVRIAVSIVQNIPYGSSDLNHWKYPYEVLYSQTGVCSEKSNLLACLLQDLGYGCEIFEFNTANHAAVGLLCPAQYAYFQDYAFVETTAPTIMTYWQGEYEGNIYLPSQPDFVIPICNGSSFNSISEEWNDAQTWNQLMQMGTVLDSYHYSLWQSLVNKYGIQVE